MLGVNFQRGIVRGVEHEAMMIIQRKIQVVAFYGLGLSMVIFQGGWYSLQV